MRKIAVFSRYDKRNKRSLINPEAKIGKINVAYIRILVEIKKERENSAPFFIYRDKSEYLILEVLLCQIFALKRRSKRLKN